MRVSKSKKDIERTVICPKCETEMLKGFLVEKNSPINLMTLGEGIYWSPGEAGVIGERIALCSYACPECGYTEQYFKKEKKIHLPEKPEPLPEGPVPEGHLYCVNCRDFVEIDKDDRNVWELECPVCGKKPLLSKVPE